MEYADKQRNNSVSLDELNISLLLVHHLRKQGDSDPLNKLSGTTGIIGAVDSVFVLDKSKRNDSNATLYCTGRDIEQRKLELKFSNCTWELISDSMDNPEMLLPREMESLLLFMKEQQSFKGNNSEYAELFNSHSGMNMSVKGLKQMMNRYRYKLEDNGLFFNSHRSNGVRLLEVQYRDESAVSDATNSV